MDLFPKCSRLSLFPYFRSSTMLWSTCLQIQSDVWCSCLDRLLLLDERARNLALVVLCLGLHVKLTTAVYGS